MNIKSNYLWALLLIVFTACQRENSSGNPENSNCFTNDPINEYSWLNDAVTFYTQPKSGETAVSVYLFKNNYYVAVENPSMNSPASFIFNCSGTTIGELNISYNAFMDSAKRVTVLMHEINN